MLLTTTSSKTNQSKLNSLDRIAIHILLGISFANLIIFPYYKSFLKPSDLYTHYPEMLHPFIDCVARSRQNVQKLSVGIEHSPPIFSLPMSGQVFCFVETSTQYYSNRVPSVAATWLPKCDNGRFFTKTAIPDSTIPFSTVYRNLEDSYDDLFRKTIFGFYYTYKYISQDFEWYLKSDDDTYFMMDHLREYLNQLDPYEPHYLGYRLKPFLKDGYNSGGSGYILSNKAVELFAKYLYHDEKACPYDWAEDRGIGRCLASMDIFPGDTRDENGMNRFNAFRPEEICNVPPQYHYYPLKNGTSISDKFVSLHRISPVKMTILDRRLETGTFDSSFFDTL